jgi:hypothetical protein
MLIAFPPQVGNRYQPAFFSETCSTSYKESTANTFGSHARPNLRRTGKPIRISTNRISLAAGAKARERRRRTTTWTW